MTLLLVLLAATTALPGWAHRDGVGSISERVARHDALVITPQARGILTARKRDDAAVGTPNASERETLTAVWRKPCERHCESLSQGCPRHFCNNLTATMGMLDGHISPETRTTAAAFLRAGAPAAQEVGLSNETVPILGSLFKSGYYKEVWAVADETVRLNIVKEGIPDVCLAHHCEHVVHLLPALANDTWKDVRRFFASRIADPVCSAGYCKHLTPLVKELAVDSSYQVRRNTASFAFPTICTHSFSLCKEVLPDIVAQSRDTNPWLISTLVTDTLPAVCTMGLFGEIEFVLLNLTKSRDRNVRLPARITLKGCEAIVKAQQMAIAADKAKAKVVKDHEKSLHLLENLEVERIRAKIAEKQAFLKLEEASHAQEMANNAKADMAIASARAQAQLDAERALADDLKGKLWGCAAALGAAMVPVVAAGVSWAIRHYWSLAGAREDRA